MAYPTLPTWKEFVAAQKSAGTPLKNSYPVLRLLRPTKYPSWGLVTAEFRFSINLPEDFISALKFHETSCSYVKFTIEVHESKPTFVCQHREVEGPIEEGDIWYTIKIFQSWVALDEASGHAVANTDEVNSADKLRIDEQALANFSAPLSSLSRQKGSKRSKKPGQI